MEKQIKSDIKAMLKSIVKKNLYSLNHHHDITKEIRIYSIDAMDYFHIYYMKDRQEAIDARITTYKYERKGEESIYLSYSMNDMTIDTVAKQIRAMKNKIFSMKSQAKDETSKEYRAELQDQMKKIKEQLKNIKNK